MKFYKSQILLDQQFETREDLFAKIASLAVTHKISTNAAVLITGFKEREEMSSTGFEDGFAIPHTRTAAVLKPAVFVVRNNLPLENWPTLDNNPVKCAIALLIPADSGNLHMDILAKIATKLTDQNFRQIIKTANLATIHEHFQKLLSEVDHTADANSPQKTDDPAKLIVGISACPAGIAHTFMAKQKMEQAARELNLRIRWETQGANGIKTPLTPNEIAKAEAVIIASDIDINLDRFTNKKIHTTSTSQAIKNPQQLIKKALTISPKSKMPTRRNIFAHFSQNMRTSFGQAFSKPWIYMGFTGTLLALISLIGYSVYGREWTSNGLELNQELFQIQAIAQFSLYLAMPFTVGSIAKNYTKRPEAFALAFVGSLLINLPTSVPGWNSISSNYDQPVKLFFNWNGIFPENVLNTGANVLGAMVVLGVTILCIQLVVKFENTCKNKSQLRFFKPFLEPWIIIFVPTLIVLGGVVFLLGAPLSYVTAQINYGIIEYADSHWWLRFVIGGAFGWAIVYDLGGIVNKITLVCLIGLSQYDLRFTSFIAVGIPIASLGYGTVYKLFSKRFNTDDALEAKKSFKKGLSGMSEGPLLALNKYGWRVALANWAAGFVSVGVAYVLGIYIFKGGLLGIFYLGAQGYLAVPNDLLWLQTLLPVDWGFWTALISIIYGIIGYLVAVSCGIVTYLIVSWFTFQMPGKNQILLKPQSIKNNLPNNKKA